MLAVIAVFDRKDLKKTYQLKGKTFAQMKAAFADYADRLKEVTAAVVYVAGRGHAAEPAGWLTVKNIRLAEEGAMLTFDTSARLEVAGGAVSDEVYKRARMGGWLTEEGFAPTFVLMDDADFDVFQQRAVLCAKMDKLTDAGDYKAAVMLCAPLKVVKDDAVLWDSTEVLYRLGYACSKLATTLLIKASETKKLDRCRQYREMCEVFLTRGAELEPDSARCVTALAYRYYSNVHELMRPGERRDQDLDEQIEKANEWLSRSLEIYPQSVRNNYRKGKLIIEKQAPYLLFGKRAFGAREAELLREIREVGEEHLATAIELYEALEDDEAKARDRREYAKALFVLGGYYLDDAYLPVHEYFLRRIVDRGDMRPVAPISKLDITSAVELLEKAFHAETDMPLDKLDVAELTQLHKQWTRSPVEKLYKLGCAHSAAAFVSLAEGDEEKLLEHAKAALRLLQAAKDVADKSQDRKRNTWHISEKLAWTYIYLGQYDRAARLISRAKAGYIVNAYAIALLLMGTAAALRRAEEVLAPAAKDRRNLASGLTKVLLAYVKMSRGEDFSPLEKTLSAKNKRLAALLGVVDE
jgi:tetratricopeptide (TPR) repeat protein